MHFFLSIHVYYVRLNFVRVKSYIALIQCIKVPAFFYKQHFYKQRQAKTGEKSSKSLEQPEAELLLFENYWLFSSTLSSSNNKRHSKNYAKNKYVCLNAVIWLMTMNIKLKMKNRSYRYNIYRHIDLSLDMETNILNLELSSVWWLYLLRNTSVKQHKAELQKSVAYKNNRVYQITDPLS